MSASIAGVSSKSREVICKGRCIATLLSYARASWARRFGLGGARGHRRAVMSTDRAQRLGDFAVLYRALLEFGLAFAFAFARDIVERDNPDKPFVLVDHG